MKIVETYPVTLEVASFIEAPRYEHKTFYVRDGYSPHFKIVKIPAISKLPEMFQWLSDNNALDKIITLEPDIHCDGEGELTDHQRIIEEAKRGHPYAQKIVQQMMPMAGRTATWIFTDRDTAVLFKLTFGGAA